MSIQAPAHTLPDRPLTSRSRRNVAHGPGFWLIAAAFAMAMAFSAAPTPLYALYQRRDHFSVFVISLIFAAYAVGVIVSLFLAGNLSDHWGRRRVLLPALLLEVIAGLVFLLASGLPGLLTARLISGLGIGMITATATAHLRELHETVRPGAPTRADLTATAANLGGLGVGPLISGLLAQFAGSPLRMPYVIFIAGLLVAAVSIAVVPETVAPTRERPGYRPQRIAVPAQGRPRFFAATAAAFAAFAILGLFSSLAPSFVAGTMHHPSRALAGLVAFIAFGSAAIAQILLGRAPVGLQARSGLALAASGLIATSAALWLPDLTLFLAGGTVAGAGAGVLLKAAISTAAGLAPPGTRGETLAGLFLGGYIGLTVPVIGIGVANSYLSSQVSITGFALAMLALLGAINRQFSSTRNRQQHQS